MSTQKFRVAVNGYGVIGKRVADAVVLQDDMQLAGVADVTYDYRIRVAVERGYAVYASVPEKRAEMEAAGVPVAGSLDDLLRQADVVVDCTPKGIGAKNKELYQSAGVKAIWQGGEKHELWVIPSSPRSITRALEIASSPGWYPAILPRCVGCCMPWTAAAG